MGRALDTVIFNGIVFRRYASSPYYVPGMSHRQHGVDSLHREIWKAAHGPIPAGYHVHHVDHNPLNNDPANLVAMHPSEHWEHHAASLSPAQLACLRKRIRKAQVAAANWHGTKEGREWHRENAHATGFGRNGHHEKTCERCGVAFIDRSDRGGGRFCSGACKAAFRRASRVDDEDRSCAVCGSAFRVNRYATTRTCSRECASVLETRLEDRACSHCGTTFQAQPSSPKRYCSLLCAYADR